MCLLETETLLMSHTWVKGHGGHVFNIRRDNRSGQFQNIGTEQLKVFGCVAVLTSSITEQMCLTH